MQSGEVELDPPGGKIPLNPCGRAVELFGSYTLTVSWTSGSKCEISFDKNPWPIVDNNTYIKKGWISPGSDQFIYTLSVKITNPS